MEEAEAPLEEPASPLQAAEFALARALRRAGIEALPPVACTPPASLLSSIPLNQAAVHVALDAFPTDSFSPTIDSIPALDASALHARVATMRAEA